MENKIVLRKGTLGKYGYKVKKSDRERNESLRKAVAAEGYLSIFRKLNALYVLNKNTYPAYSKLYLKDRDFVHKLNN